MVRNIFGVGVLCAVLVGVVSACDSEGGQAVPVPKSPVTTQTGAGEQLPYAGAPKVDNPLPPSIMDRDPCTVLTAVQVDTLFSDDPDPGEARDTGVAHSCDWSDLNKGSMVGVQLVYGLHDGLSQVYAKKDQAAFFDEGQPVQGYPTVAYGPVDDRPNGGCNVSVGVADNLVVQADAKLPRSSVGKDDPCDAARQVADLVVTTLKGVS